MIVQSCGARHSGVIGKRGVGEDKELRQTGRRMEKREVASAYNDGNHKS